MNKDTGVGARRHRLGEDRAVHVGMTARLQHQRPPQMVRVAAHPRALLEHRLAARRRKPSTISRSGSPAACASIVLSVSMR
jgi:hypothetical protein